MTLWARVVLVKGLKLSNYDVGNGTNENEIDSTSIGKKHSTDEIIKAIEDSCELMHSQIMENNRLIIEAFAEKQSKSKEVKK